MEEKDTRLVRREKRQKRRRALASPFFAVLFTLTVISFIIPLRPKESMREKRSLAKFPEFSVQALLSGDYFDGISTWFSDTFPGRETWLDVNTAINDLHGVSNNVIDYSKFAPSDEIPVVVPTVAPTAAPDVPEPTPEEGGSAQGGEDAEPTPELTPEPTPEITPEPIPEDVEVAPPTESIEHWGGLSENEEERAIFGAALQIGGSAFEYFSFSQGLADMNAHMVSRAADIAAEYDVRFFDMPIPASVGVVLSSDMLEKAGMADEGAALSYRFAMENDNVIKVNIFNTLVEHNDEYIYFRTDHHWTALGAYYGYETFCKMAGFEPVPLSEYTELDMGDFLGTFYSTSPQPAKLETDRLYAYDPPGDITMKVYDSGSYYEWTPITDMTQSRIFSKYSAFLAGDHAMTVLINNDLPDAPNCVVYKDSYGNPWVLYLTQHYHTVYALDYRKYDAMTMRSFIQNYNISDVILAESMSNAMGEGTYKMLDMRLGY